MFPINHFIRIIDWCVKFIYSPIFLLNLLKGSLIEDIKKKSQTHHLDYSSHANYFPLSAQRQVKPCPPSSSNLILIVRQFPHDLDDGRSQKRYCQSSPPVTTPNRWKLFRRYTENVHLLPQITQIHLNSVGCVYLDVVRTNQGQVQLRFVYLRQLLVKRRRSWKQNGS